MTAEPQINDGVTHPDDVHVEAANDSDVTPGTIIGYLFGRRADILLIARCPKILVVGALLVLSAGFAREYDAEDLLREPWHLFIPHAASVLTSLILFSMIRLPSVKNKAAFSICVREYPRFLGLYWLTAPLAWIYAIPVERWLSPGDATQANLAMLGIVSLWRVVLITRVINVVYRTETTWRVLVTVLLFGDAVMLAAVFFVPVPIIQFMGGIRLTESEAVMQATKFFLQLAGYPMLFVLAIACLFALPSTPLVTESEASKPATFSRTAWIMAAGSVLGWMFVLPFTQPEQQLRRQVEHLMSSNQSSQIAEAIRLMSEHEPTDFPSHWIPPPLIALAHPRPPIPTVVEVLLAEDAAPWVRNVFLEKLRRALPDVFALYRDPDDDTLIPYLRIMTQQPVKLWYDENDWSMYHLPDILRSRAEQESVALSDETRQYFDRILNALGEPSLAPKKNPDSQNDTEASPPEL